jgi:hypothetical protein
LKQERLENRPNIGIFALAGRSRPRLFAAALKE